jgi:hypothetical protein
VHRETSTEKLVVLDLELTSRGFASEGVFGPERFAMVTGTHRYVGRYANQLPSGGSTTYLPCEPTSRRLPLNETRGCSVGFTVPVALTGARVEFDDGALRAVTDDVSLPAPPVPNLSGAWVFEIEDRLLPRSCTAALVHVSSATGERLWIASECVDLETSWSGWASVEPTDRRFQATNVEGEACPIRFGGTYSADGNQIEGAMGCDGRKLTARRTG